MDDPWESAEFSLERARHHAEDFVRLSKEYLESEPYTTSGDINAETGLREIKVKVVKEFPIAMRGAASDAVKNIRDALDQAMSAAVFVLTGKRKRQAHFPFGESEADLENSLWTEADRQNPAPRKTRNTSDIPEELFPAIRFIKPYPHEGDDFHLKLLQKVSGGHKHAVSLAVGFSPAMGIQTFGVETGNGESFRIDFPDSGGSKGEFIIATYPPIRGDDELQFHVPMHVAFDHAALRKVPAAHFLFKWGRRTEWIINGLKKTTARIIAERSS